MGMVLFWLGFLLAGLLAFALHVFGVLMLIRKLNSD